ncbi:glycoside hydrolase family 31 protein [Rhizodiscina lignyota]|uniref:Glycoside hydrolase family 31 protein n=1 Tax=Rhizodiscina lignyota TaxID=1504668 RepID=A0A9P4IAR4_9PEZI|nr:glycoside hydrolase family 31 protein [Rhizodiscina lignyota]
MICLNYLVFFCLSVLHFVSCEQLNTTQPIRLLNGIERVLIQPWGPNAFRIRSILRKDPTGNELGAILDPPVGQSDALGTKYASTISFNDSAIVTNGILSVNVTGSTLSFWRSTGNGSRELLLQELWPTHGYNARVWEFSTAGTTSRAGARFAFALDPNEQIFGLGQHQNGLLNNKGEEYDMRHFQSQLTIPFYTSSKTYGFIWNVPSMGTVSVRKESVLVTAAQPGDFGAIMESYTAITGRSPHMPKEAQGYLQSKLRYSNQSEIERVANEFKQRKIPVSMFVIDFGSWDHLGDWKLNETAWPDPKAMSSFVRSATGAGLMTSVWPLVQPESPNWINFSMNGYLSGSSEGTGPIDYYQGEWMQEIDATNADCRSAVWALLKKNYYNLGIQNMWLDSSEGNGEGEGYSFKGGIQALQRMPYARPNSMYSLGSQAEVGAMFPFFEQQMIEDGIKEEVPNAYSDKNKSPGISLSRSAWLGSQRFGSATWNGDVQGSWDEFPIQIIGGMNAQLSGVAWWNTDIGGFYSQGGTYWSNISDPTYQELFVRWIEFGTFSPLMRNHGSRSCAPEDLDGYNYCPNEPWSYGPANEKIITKYIQLRYTLGDYLDALVTQQAATGAPINRPLFYDFAVQDPYTLTHAEDLKLQFMFGPNMLIAPVTEKGARSVQVYLPDRNTQWKSWWSNETFSGGHKVNASAPLDTIPIFYRGAKSAVLDGSL